MDFIFLQKITAVIFLFLFFSIRFLWTYMGGKRKKVKVTKEIIGGRFWITNIVYIFLPFILIFDFSNLFNIRIFSHYHFVLYLIGVLSSLFGLILMFMARFHRLKDWGYMGDDTGNILFTKGVYSITRHPYYMGALFLGVGVYLVLNSWLILTMFPVFLFVSKVIKKEDDFLFDKFDGEWMNYKKHVGIIPFLGF